MKSGVPSLLRKLEEIHAKRERLLQEETVIIKQLRLLTILQTEEDSTAAPLDCHSLPPGDSVTDSQFTPGKRVYIENRIHHLPSNCPAGPKDRAAIVQRTRNNQVFIRTYNGHDTWRSPRNLRLLTPIEHNDIVNL